MKVMFINNDGGGFADYVEVADGTTVKAFFEKQLGGGDPHNYLIRVNRMPAAADQKLNDLDRVTITPTKVEGANGQSQDCQFSACHSQVDYAGSHCAA